jgi:hypothetical protein
MPDEHRDDLTPEQQALLDGLPRETMPPAELEERVVDALHVHGLVRRPPAWGKLAAVAATFVIAVSAAYMLGLRAGARQVPPPVTAEATYALMIFDPVAGVPPEQTAAAVTEASRWAGELAAAGTLVSAEKLRDEATRLRLRDGAVERAADFPPPGESLVLGGFFLIRAADDEEAQRIAAACPLLRYGSVIEVRAFEEV